jgi:hypothetical protein
MVIYDGRLKGAFKGFRNRDTVFKFTNGQKWRQCVYKYHYHYAYRPAAKIIQTGSGYVLKVDGMNDSVEVARV